MKMHQCSVESRVENALAVEEKTVAHDENVWGEVNVLGDGAKHFKSCRNSVRRILTETECKRMIHFFHEETCICSCLENRDKIKDVLHHVQITVFPHSLCNRGDEQKFKLMTVLHTSTRMFCVSVSIV